MVAVPYPNPLMNLNCGRHGWKDWWVKHGEKMKFDNVAMDAHLGVWIYAPTKNGIYERLCDSVKFLNKRGYKPSYVEVGYPTTGFKPLIGLYGWGREKDQINVLDSCYRALTDTEVLYMQICEFIDPSTQLYDFSLPSIGKKGQVPKFLGIIPVLEEKHWGLLKADGTEKKACNWVKEITNK